MEAYQVINLYFLSAVYTIALDLPRTPVPTKTIGCLSISANSFLPVHSLGTSNTCMASLTFSDSSSSSCAGTKAAEPLSVGFPTPPPCDDDAPVYDDDDKAPGKAMFTCCCAGVRCAGV